MGWVIHHMGVYEATLALARAASAIHPPTDPRELQPAHKGVKRLHPMFTVPLRAYLLYCVYLVP